MNDFDTKIESFDEFINLSWVNKIITFIVTDVINYNMDGSFCSIHIKDESKRNEIFTAFIKMMDKLVLLPNQRGSLDVKIEHYLERLLVLGNIYLCYDIDENKFICRETPKDEDKLSYNVNLLFDGKSYMQRIYDIYVEGKKAKINVMMSSESSYKISEEIKILQKESLSKLKMALSLPPENYINENSMIMTNAVSLVDTGIYHMLHDSIVNIIKSPLKSKFGESSFSILLHRKSNMVEEYAMLERKSYNHLKSITDKYEELLDKNSKKTIDSNISNQYRSNAPDYFNSKNNNDFEL
jgi:hypothetical protein